MAKVSLCITAYNEMTAYKLLESIEKQTFTDFEVIITDDSENDNIKNLVADKAYIKYYKNEKRLGATANYNEAIKKSTGEYIKSIHFDDWFSDEDSLKSFVDMLDENPDAVLAFSGTRQCHPDHSYERFISDDDLKLLKADFRNLFLGNTIGGPSAVMFRRPQNGEPLPLYDENILLGNDTEYWMQLLNTNPNFVAGKKALVCIGVDTDRTSVTRTYREDSDRVAREHAYMYEKYNLKGFPEYRAKLIKVFLEADKPYRTIKPYGISSSIYRKAQIRRFFGKVKWKITHFSLLGIMKRS
ncbi:MAG: glycosyltransferase [Lachnospiraceae bacterium]|nr:glycosyltransferase [Lachnospiraceae bacterium]